MHNKKKKLYSPTLRIKFFLSIIRKLQTIMKINLLPRKLKAFFSIQKSFNAKENSDPKFYRFSVQFSLQVLPWQLKIMMD